MLDEWLIWWTNSTDVYLIDALTGDRELGPSCFPEYLGVEYRSRNGRNGRSRLWVPPGCSVQGIPWDSDRLICRVLANEENSYAGIVFRKEDALLVLSYPGLVTDQALNHVTISDVQVPF